ncbi:Ctr copper transporter family protein [Mytilinidion resinicola]|uniref:Copper transport protein n=1 Tax=Mytilinidion resinicola TaxID=574789 RepID=A0A6A6YD05_9PEZI|nr:Ctr copper transporter family protein [Mytilinidion resinicola]KAF2806590.1 Ctr copper transporter family protein [Mytilinidion resinicola]
MDHSHMDHGNAHRCNMNMLFTWGTQDLCIVFRQWHVSGTFSLLWSLLAIVLLTAGYEAVREISRRYEAYSNNPRRVDEATSPSVNESSSLLWSGRSVRAVERRNKMVNAAFYALQVFYSFFIMLLFMTYNGWVMLAVAVGAFLGYMTFGNSSSATKGVACH